MKAKNILYIAGVTKCQLAGRGEMGRWSVLFLGVPILAPKQDGTPLFGDTPTLRLHYTLMFPDPRFFAIPNIADCENDIKCG